MVIGGKCLKSVLFWVENGTLLISSISIIVNIVLSPSFEFLMKEGVV